MKALLLLSLLFTNQAFADDSCREESLVHFFSQGREVSSELIGADNPCDQFGGNRVLTPKFNIYFYVNFNIAGNVNLDQFDEAFAIGNHKDRQKIKVAVVEKTWIKRVYHDDREAILNFGGDTLFISAPVLEEGRLIPLLRDFYGMN